MSEAILIANELSKRYSAAPLFSPVSFTASSGEIIAITGANGTGKSTLLKILAKVLSPTKGTCTYQRSGNLLTDDNYQEHLGFAAPYLELYAELTALEHLEFVAELKLKTVDRKQSLDLLIELGLDEAIVASDRQVKFYSSGMQQRVKLAMAFAFEPNFIFLDEPSTNLDGNGTAILFEKIRDKADRGAIVIIATNDVSEAALAMRQIQLLPWKSSAQQY